MYVASFVALLATTRLPSSGPETRGSKITENWADSPGCSDVPTQPAPETRNAPDAPNAVIAVIVNGCRPTLVARKSTWLYEAPPPSATTDPRSADRIGMPAPPTGETSN